MGDVGNLLPPPYGLADNAESLLAVSDLVFIDPVSTGYSRTVEGTKPGRSTATRATSSRSARSSASGPRGTSAGCRRSSSPASPTALRGAALVEHLQSRHGMYVNGLILISSVLDVSSIDFENQRNDRAHALYLPTYAAIAHYGKLGRKSLKGVLAEAGEYAARGTRGCSRVRTG